MPRGGIELHSDKLKESKAPGAAGDKNRGQAELVSTAERKAF